MGEAGSRSITTRHVVLVTLLLAAVIIMRYRQAPVPSTTVPGTFGFPPTPFVSDPPSMDELWHLALTTGRGAPYSGYRLNELARDVPPAMTLDGAPPWWTVWSHLDSVTYPPLYLQTLRLWRNAFGDSTAVALTYPVAWSCVFMAMVYVIANRLYGMSVAVWASLIVATAQTQIYFGLEIRGYANLACASALLLYTVIRVQRDGATRGNCLLLGGSLVIAMLTHYHALGVGVIAGVLAMVWARTGKRWRVIVAGLGAGAVYAVVWLPFAVRQLGLLKTDTGFLDYHGSPLQIIALALQVPLRLLSEETAQSGLATLVGAGLIVGSLWLSRRNAALRPVAIWLGGGVLWMMLMDFAQQTRQVGMIRYAAALSPAAVMIIPALGSAIATKHKRWLVHALGAISVGGCLLLNHAAIRSDAYTFFQSAQIVAPRMKPGQTLIVYSSRGYLPWAALLDFLNVPGLFPRDVVLLDKPMTPETRASLRDREAWYIELGRPTNVSEIIPDATVLEVVPVPLVSPTGDSIIVPAYRLGLEREAHVAPQ